MTRALLQGATLACWVAGLTCLAGCPSTQQDKSPVKPTEGRVGDETTADIGQSATTPKPPGRVATAAAEDVEAAKKLLDKLGPDAHATLLPVNVMTEIVIQDGSVLTAEDIALFGRLTDLEKFQLYNFRSLNDEMAAQLMGLKKMKALALTNSLISDGTVDRIITSFPDLIELNLSSNTMLTNAALKAIGRMSGLERLTVIQNRFDDLGTIHLANLQNLRVLDLRGNMDASDMTMEVVADLPKLTALKHRSSTVTDYGVECLIRSKTLSSLLMQDFNVTGQAGQSIAQLEKLTQLEIFRCQGFTSDGVLALKGMKLSRLTLRDLPVIDDEAMEVFTDLPALKRLYLHELASVSDFGLQNLGSLKSLELLDIWAVPQMTDATVDVIATLPNLKELSIRTTDVTDAATDKLLAMPKLQSLTFKENGKVTAEGLKKLAGKKWSRLDID